MNVNEQVEHPLRVLITTALSQNLPSLSDYLGVWVTGKPPGNTVVPRFCSRPVWSHGQFCGHVANKYNSPIYVFQIRQ